MPEAETCGSARNKSPYKTSWSNGHSRKAQADRQDQECNQPPADQALQEDDPRRNEDRDANWSSNLPIAVHADILTLLTRRQDMHQVPELSAAIAFGCSYGQPEGSAPRSDARSTWRLERYRALIGVAASPSPDLPLRIVLLPGGNDCLAADHAGHQRDLAAIEQEGEVLADRAGGQTGRNQKLDHHGNPQPDPPNSRAGDV